MNPLEAFFLGLVLIGALIVAIFKAIWKLITWPVRAIWKRSRKKPVIHETARNDPWTWTLPCPNSFSCSVQPPANSFHSSGAGRFKWPECSTAKGPNPDYQQFADRCIEAERMIRYYDSFSKQIFNPPKQAREISQVFNPANLEAAEKYLAEFREYYSTKRAPNDPPLPL